MDKGYILMNPILGHRAHIFDAAWLNKMQEKICIYQIKAVPLHRSNLNTLADNEDSRRKWRIFLYPATKVN